MPRFDAAPFIKDIGRGSQHPTDLTFERALQLWGAVLDQRLDPVALGGVLIAFRVKGETATEIAAFLAASQDNALDLSALSGWSMPVVIPSYNGARKMPNLTPLLALLLARHGVPVLVHGGRGDDIPQGRPQRVTSAALFAALGLPPVWEVEDIARRWSARAAAFVAIETLHPGLARVLGLRAVLGVRSSAHTLVKLLQPFAQRALCLSSYTHPEYLVMLSELLSRDDVLLRQDSMVLRATEGEAVANARRAVPMQCFSHTGVTTLEPEGAQFDVVPGLPATCGVEVTVQFIEDVLAGRAPVPAPIAWQIKSILAMRQAAAEKITSA